jgi:hypothetical protein
LISLNVNLLFSTGMQFWVLFDFTFSFMGPFSFLVIFCLVVYHLHFFLFCVFTCLYIYFVMVDWYIYI